MLRKYLDKCLGGLEYLCTNKRPQYMRLNGYARQFFFNLAPSNRGKHCMYILHVELRVILVKDTIQHALYPSDTLIGQTRTENYPSQNLPRYHAISSEPKQPGRVCCLQTSDCAVAGHDSSNALKGNCSPSENTYFFISFKQDFGLH